MTAEDFGIFTRQVCEELERVSRTTPEQISACKSGEGFERCVVDACLVVINANYPGARVYYTAGSHAFPDIMIEFASGERYGIEVKSSSSATSKSWKINGNSVLGSTKEDVLDTYIIFGKTARGRQAFRYKRYEEAVANVGVTHSPRYLIDLDVAPEETFFVKSGLSYKEISESDNPIGLITSYFRSCGEQAWWLGEDKIAPAVIRVFSDLLPAEQEAIIARCFAHFPEIFSNDRKKFHRCAIWMAVERSVLAPSLRDSFSAGGKKDVELSDGTVYPSLPRIFTTLHDHRRAIREALAIGDMDAMARDWGVRPGLRANVESSWAQVVARAMEGNVGAQCDRAKMVLDILRDK